MDTVHFSLAVTTVEKLQASVGELAPYKMQIEELNRKELEKEMSEKRESLKKVATKGGFISEDELENSEDIKAMIETLDEKGIKALIAERFIKKLDDSPTPSSLETSSLQHNKGQANLYNDDEEAFDHRVVMSTFLKNN
ncbi:hypothetical protein ADS79_03210 [Brevibacillus reuszeri]|uniref:Uncharacterized protein n=1 Tax=Brevibacillus reuszeri TaxID=54915 RepID=A0A0K9YZX3_9BACL|nr:hypothetical protein ADS79_03210 [Brevibacillus reuszeri]